MTAPTPMIGRRFGRLMVIADAPSFVLSSGRLSRQVLVRCDCGNEKLVLGESLRTGRTRSCGCLRQEVVAKSRSTHGDTRPSKGRWASEYVTWSGAVARCTNTKERRYADYGGRGIKMCDRWRFGEGGLSGYECFLADMGRKPTLKHSIDRIDNEGNYEPGNCRWATASEQRLNSRNPNRGGRKKKTT